jgi:hypothetical protein
MQLQIKKTRTHTHTHTHNFSVELGQTYICSARGLSVFPHYSATLGYFLGTGRVILTAQLRLLPASRMGATLHSRLLCTSITWQYSRRADFTLRIYILCIVLSRYETYYFIIEKEI